MKFFKTVGILSIIAIVSKVLGFGRDAFIAAYFGSSGITDAYFIAITIPTLLFTALSTAIATGIIPMYVRYQQESQQKAKEFVSLLGTIFLLLSVVLTLISYLFVPQIIHVVAGKFTAQQMALTINLTYITLPSLLFYVMSSYATGIANAHQKFIVPSLVTVPNNMIIILSVIVCSSTFGITGVAWGSLLGVVSQFLIQAPFLMQTRIGLNFSFIQYKKELKDSLISFVPIIIASLAVQMSSLTDQMVASRLSAGSVSALNYSQKILYLPYSIIVMTLITVLYPSIVEIAKTAREQFMDRVFKGMNVILLSCLPFAVVMMVFAKQIVQIIYQRGAFDSHATDLATYSFFWYVPALFSLSIRDYFIRCLMALEKNRATMVSSIVFVPVNIAFSVTLSRFFAHGGIAMATSIATFLQSIFLFYWIVRSEKLANEQIKSFIIELIKMIILFFVLVAAMYLSKSFIGVNHLYIDFILHSILCFVLFGLFGYVLKIKEFSSMIDLVKKKVKR